MRRDYIIQLIEAVGVKRPVAEQIVARLQAENLLNLDYGEPEVNQICNTFKETFGTTKTSRYDRYAASRLADKYSAPTIVGLIKALAANADEPYAPVVKNVADLEVKLVSVIAFLRKRSISEVEI